MDGEQSKFEASASALGYAYQFRYALLRALEQIKYSLDWTIAIEAADDVEVSGTNRELRQLKLRQPGTTLGDSDPDLWKTVRIWSEGYRKRSIDPTATKLYLMTTAGVTPDSIGALLSADESVRDIAAAQTKLDSVSITSTNKKNKSAYDAYRLLSKEQKTALLQAIYVIPRSDDIDGVRTKIQQAIRVGLRQQHLIPVLERLEGWWFQQCIEVMNKSKPAIDAAELDGFVADVRDRFGPTALPIDHDILNSETPDDIAEFANRTFVQQMVLTEISSYRMQVAVREYLRAVAQRTRWSRINVLHPGELEKYERKLTEEWRIVFERLKDELGPEAAEEEKVRLAKKIYGWAEDANLPPIRENCTEGFVIRGTFQILADSQQVGWHPEYAARLLALLEPTGAGNA
ncbi:ABC-three component system protein [Lentzea flava]|uniref:ABC-three component systems C-terminal domain-containing protein n=1 Tax=Lentzea flava TaxID=103732 RepID=A0ABQ2URE3_9PSEU|nr:ABC-three component system protein [Lentzea flava]MCP2200821.1 hypothetical protein [Lentzea flava]GGU47624.1 hypothetical protein GCM10010178_45490 [Lentzea flava]